MHASSLAKFWSSCTMRIQKPISTRQHGISHQPFKFRKSGDHLLRLVVYLLSVYRIYTWQVVVWDYFHHQQYFHVHLWFIVGGILFFMDHLDSYQVEVTKSYPTCYPVRLAVQQEDSQRKKSQPYLLSLGYGQSGWGKCESGRKAIEDGSIYVLSPVCLASCGGTCAWSLLMYYCFVSCVCCACI